MPSTIPTLLVGKNVTLASVQPEVPNASGVLTPGTSYDLHVLGVFDSFEYEGEFNLAEISPLDGTVRNYQGTKEDFTITIGEIEKADGSSNLMNLWATQNYIRVECDAQAPGGATTQKFAAIGIRATIRKGFVEDKNAVLMTLRPCGLLAYWGTGTPPV